jgi:hypothetical protein
MLPQKTWLETIAIKNALAIMLAMKTRALCFSSIFWRGEVFFN